MLDGSPVVVTKLINYAYVRDYTTQPSSVLPAEATGAYVFREAQMASTASP